MICKVISHRGANKHAPQNTLPAFEKSIQIVVDGFETDIHVTKDGIPVVCHNYTIDETSDGKGLIADMTLDELRKYDFGSYFSSDFKGTKIPTLEEFLTLCERAGIEILNIELKSPKQGETGIVQKTIDAVKAHGLFDKLIISSFDAKLLVEAKQIDSSCRTGLLYSLQTFSSAKVFFMPATYASSIKADALHPHFIHVTPGYVYRAHKKGIKVNVWTVDKEFLVKYLLLCGVDGIITNIPEMVKSIISKRNK
jgi:glycerophosphoryl diester phosphodiesterase